MFHPTVPTNDGPRSEMPVKRALWLACVFWAIMLVLPVAFLEGLLWWLNQGKPNWIYDETDKWCLIATGLVAIAAGVSIFGRGSFLRDYWRGHPLRPGRYLVAEVVIGVALVIAGGVSLFGFLVSDAYFPNVIPGLVALGLFVVHFPLRGEIVGREG
jgi:hypothetical protein